MNNSIRKRSIGFAASVTIAACIFPFAATVMGQQEITNKPIDRDETPSQTKPDAATVAGSPAAPPRLVVALKPAAKGEAVAPASGDEDAWHIEIRPYVWFASIHGRVRVRNTTAEVDKSAGSLLGMLDFAAAAQVEAIKGRWRLIFDENYMNLGTTGTGPLGDPIKIEPTMNVFEFGASYSFAEVANKESTANDPLPPVFSAEVLGGGRYARLRLELEPTNVNPVADSRNFVGVFVGNRFKARPHEAVTLIGKYTVGTSGVGSQFAWSIDALIDVRLKKQFSIGGGYRVLGLNVDNVNNRVGFDGHLRGLMLSATIYH